MQSTLYKATVCHSRNGDRRTRLIKSHAHGWSEAFRLTTSPKSIKQLSPPWPWLTSNADTAPGYQLYPRKGQVYSTKQGTNYVQFLHKPNTACSLEGKMKVLDELDI